MLCVSGVRLIRLEKTHRSKIEVVMQMKNLISKSLISQNMGIEINPDKITCGQCGRFWDMYITKEIDIEGVREIFMSCPVKSCNNSIKIEVRY